MVSLPETHIVGTLSPKVFYSTLLDSVGRYVCMYVRWVFHDMI